MKFVIFQITRPDFQFEVPKKRKVATNIISYERYREILFQKVASGYLLHFVQDGSISSTLAAHRPGHGSARTAYASAGRTEVAP